MYKNGELILQVTLLNSGPSPLDRPPLIPNSGNPEGFCCHFWTQISITYVICRRLTSGFPPGGKSLFCDRSNSEARNDDAIRGKERLIVLATTDISDNTVSEKR
eukprot:m.64569 g.64569  ORF g.64569 m.64569 type:complete len:104 (+) comp35264_c0_seq1:427-738(+)